MVVFHPMCMCMSIFTKEDDAHAHSHPKYQLYAVHMCKQCQGHGSDTIIIKDSWIRVKARQESAGGLKVRALTQTVRGAGSSPAQCSIFSCLIKLL